MVYYVPKLGASAVGEKLNKKWKVIKSQFRLVLLLGTDKTKKTGTCTIVLTQKTQEHLILFYPALRDSLLSNRSCLKCT